MSINYIQRNALIIYIQRLLFMLMSWWKQALGVNDCWNLNKHSFNFFLSSLIAICGMNTSVKINKKENFSLSWESLGLTGAGNYFKFFSWEKEFYNWWQRSEICKINWKLGIGVKIELITKIIAVYAIRTLSRLCFALAVMIPGVTKYTVLANVRTTCAIFLHNWTQCLDGFSFFLLQGYGRKAVDAKNPAIFRFFVTEKTQLNAAHA